MIAAEWVECVSLVGEMYQAFHFLSGCGCNMRSRRSGVVCSLFWRRVWKMANK